MLNHSSSEPNIYDTQQPLPNRVCLKLFHLWIQALKSMKIFDHKGLTSLTVASQDPVAGGYSYIVKIENYSALKCCFQEVRIITHRTHSPKEVVGLLLPGSFSGKAFFKVMFLPTSRKKLPAVPRAPFSLPLSLFCPGENGDAPTAPSVLGTAVTLCGGTSQGKISSLMNLPWSRPSALWSHLL